MTYMGIVIIIITILLFLMIYKRKDLKVFWTLVILITYLLFWTILSFETSPFYFFSIDTYPFFELSDEEINTWAVRGQIGDILAGHFSALAFFAIALSIYFQSEGNNKLQKSIEQQEDSINQQKDALKIQSDALKAQIEELKESREESKKQTEEFFISNMNVKLDRYYRLLDENLEKVSDDFYTDYEKSINKLEDLLKTEIKDPVGNASNMNGVITKEGLQKDHDKKIENSKINKSNFEIQIKKLIMILNLIYDEIEMLKGRYDILYQRYHQELKLRLDLHKVFLEIKKSFEDADKCRAFSLLEEEQK